ncbi:site-specific integrase [Ureibacillus acetophenoni]
MDESLEQFIRYIQLERNFSIHTVKEYQHDLHDFLTFCKCEGISDLNEVEYLHARLYVTKLYDEKKARTSI